MQSKMNNKVIIAGAGAGKTTFLINEAIKNCQENNILITTFTQANRDEIKKKVIEKKRLYSCEHYHSDLVFFSVTTWSKAISKCTI